MKKLLLLMVAMSSLVQAEEFSWPATIKPMITPPYMVADSPAESLSSNFVKAKDNVVNGLSTFALASSRFSRESSHQFANLGNFCADHYWIFGIPVTAATLYGIYYLYSKLYIHVNVSMGFKHPDERNARR